MLEAVLTPATSLLERLAFVRQLGLEPKPLLRLLLIECQCNHDLLDCLTLEDHTPQDTPGLIAFARLLESRVLEAVLGTPDLSLKAFNELKGVQLAFPGEDDARAAPDLDFKSVASQLRSLYVRARTVQRLAELRSTALVGNPQESVRAIHFRTRLRNLRNAYETVGTALRVHLQKDAA